MNIITSVQVRTRSKRFLLEISVFFLVFIFLCTSTCVAIEGSKGVIFSESSSEYRSTLSIHNNKTSYGAGFVKCTLVLSNNTLVKGNFNISENGSSPMGIIFDPYNNDFYIANEYFNNVIVISGATNLEAGIISVGSSPHQLALDGISGNIYVTNQGSNSYTVIDGNTNKVVATEDLNYFPIGVAFDQFNGYVYFVDASGSVKVINGQNNSVIATINVGLRPCKIAYDSLNGYLYVTHLNSCNLTVINGATNSVLTNISVGPDPFGVTYDEANHYVYVTNLYSCNVTVVNTTTNSVVSKIRVGKVPCSIGYDSFNGYLYVANTESRNVTVINGKTNTVISSINVGIAPDGVACDCSNGNIYITNYKSGTVSVISIINQSQSKYLVKFTESGLPSGTEWSLIFNGSAYASATNSISLNVTNGTYSYTVRPVTGYTPSPSSGTITVSGNPVSTHIIFTFINHANCLLYDRFVSDNYINTTKWSLDSSVLQNITQTDSKLFGENITLAQPNDFVYSFSGGLSFIPSGYDNMAGFTGNRIFTYPITVNVNFSINSDPGGNSMVIISNSNGYDIAGVYLSDQAYVQSGNETPVATGYSIQNGIEYDLSMHINGTGFFVNISSSQSRYSELYQYSPGGNQTLYLTFGSFIGTFPGELYSPTHTPEIVFQNVSVKSEGTWSLKVFTNSSNGNPDSGVNITVTNAFTNITETAISPSNGTVMFNNLYSGQYYVVASQTQGGVQVTNFRYIFVGEPNDPSLPNISLPLEISPPPPSQLCASIKSLNSTTGQAPWNNTFIALPGGYVGNYTYSWYVNGVYAGSGYTLSRTFYNPNSTGTTSYKISLQVTSQGNWFGVTYGPTVADAVTEQIVYSRPIYLGLAVTSPEAYAYVSYGNHYNLALGFLKGKTIYLNANITDEYLSDTIPQWLMGIIGISYPFWGVNISNSAGNDNGIIQVLQPGSATYLNNVSLPGAITSLNQLNGSTFDVTLNPLATYAVIGDVIQVVLAAIGVVGGLSVLGGSSTPIIHDIVGDLIMQLDHASALNSFKLFTGSPISIMGAITEGIIQFLEDLLPTIPHILEQYAPNELDAIGGLIGDLSESITKIFPAWKLFDLGFDIGAVLGAAIRGNLVTQYRITGYQNSITYTVNDPGDALPYVKVSDASGYSGWNGSWEGAGYSHSAFTSSGYAFSLPSNGTSILEITNPSRTSSIQYDLDVSVDNITENLKGTLNQGSTVRYIVSSNATYVSIAKEYTVSFIEDGLPSDTPWSVTFNGTSETSSTNTITFVVPNGTYSFSIGSVSGFTSSESSGSLTVSGSNVSKTITFSSATNTNPISPFRGLSNLEIYAIIGTVILVLVVGSAVALTRRKN